MKRLINILGILLVISLSAIQTMHAQMSFYVSFPICYDNCTTQEDCVYRAYYSIVDKCGDKDTTLCSGYQDQACDEFTGSMLIQCDDCSEATHDPCLLVSVLMRKLCFGPGGTHVICEGSDQEYFTCPELTSGNPPTITITWN